MTYSASYEFQGGNQTGSVIGAEHFGTNYLFHHDRVGEGSSFPEIVDRIGIDLIRYPGGAITEEFFDLSDPAADIQSSLFGRPDRAVTPIDEFLDFAAQTGSEAIIVLPTYRYFDPVTRQIDPAAEAEIKALVRAVLAGEFGDADIRGFEIGNEWYQDRFEWSAAEFGELQSRVGFWIQEVVQEQANWSGTEIYVQAGRGDDDDNGIADNQELVAQFTQAELDAVDGLISHFYASTSSGNPLVLGGAVNRRLKEITEDWDLATRTDLDLVVTEWNIGDNGEGKTSVTGLMRSVALLNVFSNMMEKGVDLSAIWTAQAPGPAGLSNSEGDDHLTSTGYLYRMMRRELIGTQAVETVQGDDIRNDNGDLIGRTYTFQGEGRTVIYLASGIGESMDLNVDFSTYFGAGSHVHATVLGVAEGSEATDYRAEASMSTISDGELGNSGDYAFRLDAYEVVQIVITTGSGVSLYGDDQVATDDILDGTEHADALWGFAGQDLLSGFAGADLLSGGNGDDTLSGGSGADTLKGGDGDDHIIGGQDADIIVTGAGADTALGGDGNDTLDYSESAVALRIYAREGVTEKDGAGTADSFSDIENFVGSAHADTIFADATTRRVDSGAGDDFIRATGAQDIDLIAGAGDDLVLAEAGSATVDLGDGDDKLLSLSAQIDASGGAGADLIRGCAGDDTIDGGQGNDTLYGGRGADTFIYKSDGGRDVVLDFDTNEDRLDLTDLNIAFADIDVITTQEGVDLQVVGNTILELHDVAAEDVTAEFFLL